MAARRGGLQEPNSKLNRSTRVWRHSGVRMNPRDRAISRFEEEQHQARLAKNARRESFDLMRLEARLAKNARRESFDLMRLGWLSTLMPSFMMR